MTCCFFGHADTPESIREKLTATIEDLIVNHGVTTFYLGTKGRFDLMSIAAVKKMKEKYPHIDYAVVLAYLPLKYNHFPDEPTLYPDGLEGVPQRFAMTHRNKWMAKNSNIAVCYVVNSFGGAYQAMRYAKGRGAHIINLAKE